MAARSKEKVLSNKISATGAPTSQLLSWFSRDWVLGLILLLAVILAYLPVWRAVT
jgi:hypothetical protein